MPRKVEPVAFPYPKWLRVDAELPGPADAPPASGGQGEAGPGPPAAGQSLPWVTRSLMDQLDED
jgi:hypothetical protein